MENEKVYCINCSCKQPYKILKSKQQVTIRDIPFYYTEEISYCEKCGSICYVPEVNDRNAAARETAYRIAKNSFDS